MPTIVSTRNLLQALELIKRVNLINNGIIIKPPSVFLKTNNKEEIKKLINTAEHLAPGIRNIELQRIEQALQLVQKKVENQINIEFFPPVVLRKKTSIITNQICVPKMQKILPEFILQDEQFDFSNKDVLTKKY